MMNSKVNRELSVLLKTQSPYSSWYSLCENYVKVSHMESTELLDSIYTLSDESGVKDSDYYYDVVCEIMSVLAGRCDNNISLCSNDIKQVIR